MQEILHVCLAWCKARSLRVQIPLFFTQMFWLTQKLSASFQNKLLFTIRDYIGFEEEVFSVEVLIVSKVKETILRGLTWG